MSEKKTMSKSDEPAMMDESTVLDEPSTSEGPAVVGQLKASDSVVFPTLEEAEQESLADISAIRDIPVQLTVELGRTTISIENLLQLGQGSIVALDKLAGEPLNIFVNNFLVAQGEVVVVDEDYGIRLTDIVSPSERFTKLSTR